MSKIVDLSSKYKSSPEYQAELKNSLESLNNIEDELYGILVNLATSGKWKEWSDSIPDGGTFTFTEEMLKDTGDNNIDDLANLMDELIRIKKRIAQRAITRA